MFYNILNLKKSYFSPLWLFYSMKSVIINSYSYKQNLLDNIKTNLVYFDQLNKKLFQVKLKPNLQKIYKKIQFF